MAHLTEPLKVASILMHRNMDDAQENGKHLVMSLLELLVLDVFVPEGMR
jgi:hypothetical protein